MLTRTIRYPSQRYTYKKLQRLNICPYVQCRSRARILCTNGRASMSGSSRLIRTIQNMRQELFLSTCIGESYLLATESPRNPVLLKTSYQNDFDSSDNEESTTDEKDAVKGVPVNFLSKTVYTRTGRPITLLYRALSSY